METETPKKRKKLRAILVTLLLLVIVMIIFIFVWSSEPEPIDPIKVRQSYPAGEPPVGYITVETVAQTMEALLDKSGGFLSNDITPPSIFMDNMPSFEFGALVQIRDITQILRNDISRSQSQSTEDESLHKAEPAFNINHTKWLLPRAEGEYRKGIKYLRDYRDRLTDPEITHTQFYARADNLRSWLYLVSKRLGSLSQRLSASVGRVRINTDLAGDKSAQQSTNSGQLVEVKTPWLEIDDIFWEARGSTWAIVQFMKAVEQDFDVVIKDKNAQASFRQIILELEATQEAIWSPMIVNGREFGFVANHSLVMSSYVSRANAAIIDLIDLLKRG
ncbi:DUF2333 family protein [Kangiella sp. TOML190]|uniref:DUF2333 family protein n=1 Tax=Kangiella sp. TOML190 TaxID=2931351 RepID=UPI00203C370E|nr:DUF2333 family protein [Kangiella sp. TOML190]